MKSYCSFIVINPKHTELIGSLCSRAGWSIRFIIDPSERFWFHRSGFIEISHPSALGKQPMDSVPGQLMVVDSEETAADNIIGLVWAAYDVISGSPSQRVEMRSAIELPESRCEQINVFRDAFQNGGFFKKFSHKDKFPVAVALAKKAWPDGSFVYALHKLSQSFQMISSTPWSMHPRHGQIFEKYSELYGYHVTISVAINLAFSAIEELKLQVKSSSTNVRWLNIETGEWNRAVLSDVESRLREADVDLEQKMTWIIRGDKSKSEARIKPVLGEPSSYSEGKVVRDVAVTIPEALHNCSFIRNFMTAHGFSDISKFVGPYELFNVQALARRLILSKSGLWNVGTEDLLRRL